MHEMIYGDVKLMTQVRTGSDYDLAPNICYQMNDKLIHVTFLIDSPTIQLISSRVVPIRFLTIYTSIGMISKRKHIDYIDSALFCIRFVSIRDK